VDPRDVRVVFMGSPAFAVPSLRSLIAGKYNLVGVVTQPDRPSGRGGAIHAPDVKVAAQELGIEVFQPETFRDEGARKRLQAFSADLFVVAAYGKILSRAVLSMPVRGCVNVHASLLPRWRGASPIAAAILAGDTEAGVSIMEMDVRMDAGAVIAQRSVAIRLDDTTGELEVKLAALGADLLVEVLPDWYDRRIEAVPQDESLVTSCHTLSKEDGHLRVTMTAAEAERAVRSSNPWPGAYVEYRGQRLGIWRAHPVNAEGAGKPGSTTIIEKTPAVAFAGGWLVLDEVQRVGSKRLPGGAFLNGERGQLAPEVGLRD
jgi:methionyl-tRNA formyltransferase